LKTFTCLCHELHFAAINVRHELAIKIIFTTLEASILEDLVKSRCIWIIFRCLVFRPFDVFNTKTFLRWL
jgi:hypothetical protein